VLLLTIIDEREDFLNLTRSAKSKSSCRSADRLAVDCFMTSFFAQYLYICDKYNLNVKATVLRSLNVKATNFLRHNGLNSVI